MAEEPLSFPLRLVEALLFASAEPLREDAIAERLPEGLDLAPLLAELAAHYQGRGVELVRIGGGWAFRTAPDLGPSLRAGREPLRRLSRAAVEALAIIAYHQPVTRAEIEEIRGVQLSKGTIDVLLEAGWIQPRGRRPVPGRPTVWATTSSFLDHFGLTGLDALPGVEELKAAGLLERRPTLTTLAMREEDARDEEVGNPEVGNEEVHDPLARDEGVPDD